MRKSSGEIDGGLVDARGFHRRKTVRTFLGAAVIWAIVIAVVARDAGQDSPVKAPGAATRGGSAGEPMTALVREPPPGKPLATEPVTRPMGERFVVDNLAFEILEAYFMPGGSIGVGRRALGDYLCVRARVENVDARPRSIPVAVLLDDSGAMHQGSGDGAWSRAYFSPWEELNPGLHRTARYLFDVPAGRQFRLVVPAEETGRIAAVVPLTITDFPAGR